MKHGRGVGERRGVCEYTERNRDFLFILNLPILIGLGD